MAAKWQALAERIAAEIRDGTRAPGTALPYIREFVAQGEGSKATVNRAYQELEADGYVISVRGQGTVVRDRTPVRVPLDRYSRTLDPTSTRGPWETATAEQGLDGRMVVDDPAASTLDAPADVAELLELAPSSPVVCRRRRAMIGRDVVQLQEAWYPLDVAEAAHLDRPEKIIGGVLAALIAAGITPAAMSEYVTAEAPTADQAARLAIGARVSVLLVDHVTYDQTGRAVELVRMAGAADRLRLAYERLPLQIRRPRTGRPTTP
ncbi:GntR family transcriptional regulator [Streptomyces sp. H10-C2]|uniref:GntR family transcriptional regulator n=1 Tax=unclassified Streptomyces TaxID=2593676 RepID=UPI0024BB1EF4|nr:MULTISPECIES: GntR family transcriptional regulator [unclassified Streptomyces]MDJ0345534.1 GntR family transcriptional regulator [Streptomyces sp. PH10-H1]MDJ0374480.1 GntR family transcriptional regulator [Streptomyces sp. H10-C2]